MGKIHHNPNVMWREEDDAMAGEREALERGDAAGDAGTSVLFSGGTMLSLNILGTEIWKRCNGRELDEVVADLLESFEVDEDTLRTDVTSFLDELAEKGFITHAQ
jgi:GeoRSP system PqqD family protein